MIFPKDFEYKIGFNNIRDILSENCETSMGKDLVSQMRFSTDFNEIKSKLIETDEMVSLINNSVLPGLNIHDILPFLLELKIENSYLSPEKLNKIKTTLISMKELFSFFNEHDFTDLNVKSLKELFLQIPDFSIVINELDRCLDKFGDIKDSASPELREIRAKIRRASGNTQRLMQLVLDKNIKEGNLDKETIPVIREGRLLIPIAAVNKKKLNGIVHDYSATGKTAFIEPLEVVEATNRLRELELEEKRIIINLLIELANFMRPYSALIKEGLKLLAYYDFLKAKANFAVLTNSQLPHLSEKIELEWYNAVHPVLLITLKNLGKNAVPININLTPEKRFLIISGPNAGGKSVCLKTTAIVQYMMQCGMLPSLANNSHMGIFKKIFIDIGDEQSIENDLSTYSSHLLNMKFFLQNSDNHSLILADEMGSGTEPQIGGALAQSILTYLGNKESWGVVTTHYQNLKTFADKEQGFVNGAMQYDRQMLTPTFQLVIGHPGSSFALDIARKIGLPLQVIKNAEEIVGSEYVDIDKFLLDIQRDRKYWQNKRLSIKEKEHKLDVILEKYEESARELKNNRAIIIKEAKKEAQDILSGANAMIERSIHEIRKIQAEKEKTKQIREELKQYQNSLNQTSDNNELKSIIKSLPKKKKPKKENLLTRQENLKQDNNFSTGDYVKIGNNGIAGKILSIDNQKAEVAFGNLRSFVELKKLIKANAPKENQKDNKTLIFSQESDTSRERQLNFKNEIDLRGLKADEALQAVTYFIDDAIQFNIPKVRILHGTGHGILKTIIRNYLQSNKNILSFYDEDVRFGGAGITVVELS